MIGKIISHYRVVARLGEGGMGVVYRARDLSLDRDVAIKFLPPRLQSDERAKQRFVREAKAASALNHRNIAVVHSIDTTDEGHMFIVMACYEGETLHERIQRGPVPVAEALDITAKVGAGLRAAHAKGILHRDVKPANIFLTEDGGVRLADFGLAQLVGESRLTKSHTTVGTLSYMSPEQARGDVVDERTDIFSLGSVLYEMLAGRRPFQADHEAAVIYQILNKDPQSLTGEHFPGGLVTIVEKALCKDRGGRFQNAEEMAATIDSFRSGRSMPPSRRRGPRQHTVRLVGAAALIALAIFAYRNWIAPPDQNPALDASRPMIAVVPFRNLGPAEDEYFADGMTEEITSQLAAVRELGVIARSSVAPYKYSERPVEEIGSELGVDYVLEGSVRWDRSGDSSRVRITPLLIRVSDATHVWSQRYDRVIDDIFAVQADIAGNVISAVGVALVQRDPRAPSRMSSNPEAYQAYLRGLAHMRENDIPLAMRMLTRAVELDSTFARAYAQLSIVHSGLYHYGQDATRGRLRLAYAAAHRAQTLAPDLAEAHLAFGYYHYWGRREYAEALISFGRAAEGLPNDVEALIMEAAVNRRMGRFEDAIALLESAAVLNPRDDITLWELAYTYQVTRRYGQAQEYFDRAIALAPDVGRHYLWSAMNYQRWTGDLPAARRELERIPDPRLYRNTWTHTVYHQLLYERDFEAALEFSLSLPEPVMWWQLRALPAPLLAATAQALMGQTDAARASFEQARLLLEEKLAQGEHDARIHSALGLVYAGLGLESAAVRQGRLGVTLAPDALIGSYRRWDLAMIHAMAGDADAALDIIETVLSVPNDFSRALLLLDPRWDSLRDHPRYLALVTNTS